MKQIVLTLALVAFVVASIAYADEPAPEIVIPKLRHDFGKVFEREAYAHDFVVRNRGSADLLIDNVKPG